MRFPHAVIALTCLISAGILMSTTGIGAHLGGTPNPGLEGQDEAPNQDELDKWESDQKGTDSLIGMAITAGNWMASSIRFVVLAPMALQNLGFSAGIATALALPIWAISAFFLMGLLRGVGRLL